jgi:hypothetical protein
MPSHCCSAQQKSIPPQHYNHFPHPLCLKIGEKIISSFRNYHERCCFSEVVRGDGVEAIKMISPSSVCPGETHKSTDEIGEALVGIRGSINRPTVCRLI